MKYLNQFSLKLTGLIIGLGILSLSTAQACERSYNIRVAKNYPPYFMTDSNGHHFGMEVEFAQQVMAASGCKYQLVELPWRRALLQLRQGDLDILTVASYTEERNEFSRFSVPYRQEVVGLLMRKGDLNRQIGSLQDLVKQNLVVAYLRGAYHGPEFKKIAEEESFKRILQPVTKVVDFLPALAGDRIDAILTDVVAMSLHLEKENKTDELGVHDFHVFENNVYFMMSRVSVSEQDEALINKAIQQVIKDGDNPFRDWLPN